MDSVELADLNIQTASHGGLVSERSIEGKGNFSMENSGHLGCSG
jgi:hypothetical protein